MDKEDDIRKTYFIDIDGTILKHRGTLVNIHYDRPEVLDGVQKFFNQMLGEDSYIVLTTARKESMRELTEKQLKSFGLFWDVLLMGIGCGPRIVINDVKPECKEMAVGINVERDVGLENLI